MRFFISLIGLLLLLAAAVFFGHSWLSNWGLTENPIRTEIVVELPRGDSLANLSKRLKEQNVVSSAGLFQLWVKLHADYSRFQAGLYRFDAEISPAEIARKFQEGDNFVPVVFEYTIPEGFTVRKVIDRLVAKGLGSEEEFHKLVTSKAFREKHKIEASSLEGYLYPATYQFSEFPSAEAALSRAIQSFWDKLPSGYLEQISERGLSLDQAVAFASLIELETGREDEKAKVSEVIWRRLKDGVALGIDAALIYGIPDYDGDIKTRHLRDRKNRYNTRIYTGLPPTAIGSPSRSSLLAILSPTSEGHYYYVLDAESEDGRHKFTKTLREHNLWVRKLVKSRRQHRNSR